MASRPFARCLAYIEMPRGVGDNRMGRYDCMEGSGDAQALLAGDVFDEVGVGVGSVGSLRSHHHRKSGGHGGARQRGLRSGSALSRNHSSTHPSTQHSSNNTAGEHADHNTHQRVPSPFGSTLSHHTSHRPTTTTPSSKHRTSICSFGSDLLHGNFNNLFSTADERFSINPVALEPADDGIAGVCTVLFQMPSGGLSGGGEGANTPSTSVPPVSIAFGSALVSSTRVMYPSLSRTQPHIQRQGSTSV